MDFVRSNAPPPRRVDNRNADDLGSIMMGDEFPNAAVGSHRNIVLFPLG